MPYKQQFAGLAAGMAWLLLSGCALVPGLHVNVDRDGSATAPGYRVIPVTSEVILALGSNPQPALSADLRDLVAAQPGAPPSEYRIGSGDVLQIIVWDHPELTNPFGATSRDPQSAGQLVAADGSTYFPYAGTVLVGGKTVQEVRSELISSLAAVVTRPQVDVRVVAYRAHRVEVTGEVAQPGVVTLDDTTKGVLQAITERGGLNPTASRRSASLIREGRSYRIDMGGLLSGARPSINPLLQPGDVVHVPDTGEDQVFMLGEIEQQGPVVLGQQRTTLIEALSRSEGLLGTSARDSGVLVFRRAPVADAPASIYAIDLSIAEGLLLASEFELAPRDVVYVKATAFSQYNAIINQLLPTVSAIFQLDALVNRGR